MPITPHLPFPIPPGVFDLGCVSQKTLQFDADRRIPVFELDCSPLDPQHRRSVYVEARKMITFGSMLVQILLSIFIEFAISDAFGDFGESSMKPQH